MSDHWDVRELGHDDEAGLHGYWQAALEARAHDTPDIPMEPFGAYLATVRDGASQRHRWFVASRDGRAVGGAEVMLPMQDNLGMAHVDLAVTPDARRNGAGRAAFAAACEYARSQGRTHVISDTSDPVDGPASPGSSFADAIGAKRALEEVCRRIELSELSAERLTAVTHEASAAAQGYDLVQWVGPVPDEHVDDLARLTAMLVTDAPMGELGMEAQAWDAARVRESEQKLVDGGRVWVTTAARDLASGRLVAYTDIGTSTFLPGPAFQWTTLVEKAHRGHRLGLLVKAANLRLLRDTVPVATHLFTWNADSNSHMIAINEELGFRPWLLFTQWRLDL